MIGVDTVKQDGETVHTLYADETLNFCSLKSSGNHLLSRERNTPRCAVPETADSEVDAQTESISMGHCVTFSIINPKLVLPHGYVLILR